MVAKTLAERLRVVAYWKCGSYVEAAVLLDCDRETVADTLRRWRETKQEAFDDLLTTLVRK